MVRKLGLFLVYGVLPLMALGESHSNFDETMRQVPMIEAEALHNSQHMNVQHLLDEAGAHNDHEELRSALNEWETEGAHLKSHAVHKAEENEAGLAVIESSSRHASFKVNSNDPEIRNALAIENHAEEFLQGKRNLDGVCEQMNICRSDYETKVCEATHQEQRLCSAHPVVSFETHSVFRLEHFSGNLIKHSSNRYFFLSKAKGNIKSASIALSGGDNPFWCKTTYHGYLNGYLLGEFRLPCGGGMGHIRFQNRSLNFLVESGQEIGFTFDHGVIEQNVTRATYEIDVEIEEIVAEPITTWSEECLKPIVSYCAKTEEVCSLPGETQKLLVPGTTQTMEVTLECLEKRSTYLCGLPEEGCFDEERRTEVTEDNCTLSRATCIASEGELCLREQRSYLCSHQVCDSISKICGAEIFCLKGDCVELKDPSFDGEELKKDLTDLAALSEATKGVSSEGQVNLFGGEAFSCGGDGLGYSKCCEDKGWGHDLGLSRCSEEEKRLGSAREKGWTIALGSKCTTDTPFGCLKEKQVFCVFHNKLAKLVQEYGRGQIGRSFGSADAPDCRGFSVSEIESIRFDSMPLKEAFDDEIAPYMQFKNSSEMKEHIRGKISSLSQGGHSYEK
jgi:conjugal transfer mating pair stabilization protein TraN